MLPSQGDLSYLNQFVHIPVFFVGVEICWGRALHALNLYLLKHYLKWVHRYKKTAKSFALEREGLPVSWQTVSDGIAVPITFCQKMAIHLMVNAAVRAHFIRRMTASRNVHPKCVCLLCNNLVSLHCFTTIYVLTAAGGTPASNGKSELQYSALSCTVFWLILPLLFVLYGIHISQGFIKESSYCWM